MMNIISDEVYVIHVKPFSDSRLLLYLFSKNHGRISAIFRLPSKKHTFRPSPFSLLCAQWRGNSDLKNLSLLETVEPPLNLTGTSLYCGLYVNELVQRLIKSEESHEDLFHVYHNTISNLATTATDASTLRYFEFFLLEYLGYGIDFEYDTTGKLIKDSINDHYFLGRSEGFSKIANSLQNYDQYRVFNGLQIRSFRDKNFDSHEFQNAAKRFTRVSLQPLLGNKPLTSRALFQ